MTVALIALASVIGFLLWFIYEQNKNFNDYRNRVEGRSHEHNAQITQSSNVEFERFKDLIDSILLETFDRYLKHIQILERQINPAPKPVTTKMVSDILKRTPEISEFADEKEENPIEEVPKDKMLTPDGKLVDPNAVEINDSNYMNIPISRDTKAVFEETNDEMLE